MRWLGFSSWRAGACRLLAAPVVCAVVLCAVGAVQAADTAPAVDELRKASAAYAEAFTKGDFAALADQWTTRAELVEGGTRIEGREAIVDSIKLWRERHPQASLAIELTDVVMVAEPIARVTGVMRFTNKPGDKPLESRFTGLRVKEGSVWRLAESRVTPAHVAALDDLDWLIGSWTASDATSGRAYEARYERVAGGHAILGRTTIHTAPPANQSTPSGNSLRLEVIEAIDLIHPDKATGAVRSWLFDSTGARAEGLFETDGVAFNRSFTGSTADGASAKVSRWVQVLVPTGEETMTLQSIDRTLDGRALPDGQPIHFKKSK